MVNVFKVFFIFVFALLLSIPASGIIIKVNTNKKETKTMMSTTFQIVTHSAYQIQADNVEMVYFGSTSGLQPGRLFGVSVNGLPPVFLPRNQGKRLTSMIRNSWRSQFTYERSRSYNDGATTGNPPSSFVMYYLAFNHTCFQQPPELIQQQISDGNLRLISEQLNIGDVLLVRDTINFDNNVAVIYLGQNLFLNWFRSTATFYIQDTEQLELILPDSPLFLLVKGVRHHKEISRMEWLRQQFLKLCCCSSTNEEAKSETLPPSPVAPPHYHQASIDNTLLRVILLATLQSQTWEERTAQNIPSYSYVN